MPHCVGGYIYIYARRGVEHSICSFDLSDSGRRVSNPCSMQSDWAGAVCLVAWPFIARARLMVAPVAPVKSDDSLLRLYWAIYDPNGSGELAPVRALAVTKVPLAGQTRQNLSMFLLTRIIGVGLCIWRLLSAGPCTTGCSASVRWLRMLVWTISSVSCQRQSNMRNPTTSSVASWRYVCRPATIEHGLATLSNSHRRATDESLLLCMWIRVLHRRISSIWLPACATSPSWARQRLHGGRVAARQ